MWGVLNHDLPQEKQYQSVQPQRQQQSTLPPITRNRSSVDLTNSRNYDTPLERIASMKTQRPLPVQQPAAADTELGASFKLPYI